MAAETVKLRVALAQVDATVGDVEGNAALIREWIGRAHEAGAQLVVFPELVVSGYPAEDLLLKPHFLDACAGVLPSIAEASAGLTSVVGVPLHEDGVRNAAVVLADGENRGTYHKCLLPNYGVFDERRYFEPGLGPALIEVGGVRVGLTIC